MSQHGAIVGLDFGMTNSILSYPGPNNEPIAHVMAGAETPAVPTAVDPSLMDRVFGAFAWTRLNVRENFKHLLPLVGLDARERRKNPDFIAASAFLELLLKQYLAENGHARYANVVATVPESWLSGKQQGGVETLGQILTEIGIDDPEFLSEPVAAACYFAHNYRRALFGDAPGKPFDGHILVYDHGGSTLDIAVVRVEDNTVEVISSFGDAGEPGSSGFGGVEFDKRVMARVCARERKNLSGQERAEWLRDFERQKRSAVSEIERRCKNPDYYNLRVDEIFKVQKLSVTLGDLVDTFEAVFADRIKSDISQVLSDACTKVKIAVDDPKRFKVVPIGGFSQFYPIQRLINTHFGVAQPGPGTIIYTGIKGPDRWQAVSKGACLVASNVIQINRTCPFTFGFVYYDQTEPYDQYFMRTGAEVRPYRTPKFLDEWFRLAVDPAKPDARSIVLFIENGGNRILLPMAKSFEQTLPDHGNAKRWQLGCKVDNGTVWLALKSETGESKTIRIGKLLRMIEGRIED